MKDRLRSQAVMLSKRANVFYLEHVRVTQRDDRIVYMTATDRGIDQFVSIPDKNTAFVLLGKGSSITDAAVRKFAESNVLIGFCGSGGSPLFANLDVAFLVPQDEYRPTNHAQRWFALWSNEGTRFAMGREFLKYRAKWDAEVMAEQAIPGLAEAIATFESSLDMCTSITDLLAAEGRFVKTTYSVIGKSFEVEGFKRKQGEGADSKTWQVANQFLDHGNYLAYGYAAVALHGIGVPYFLPVLHGKTRRGALVFDVADLFKDWLVIPAAFDCASRKSSPKDFRARLTDLALKHEVLDKVMTFISELPDKITINQ